MSNIPSKTPISELAEKARRHYAELSASPNSFNSIIPEAINIWEKALIQTDKFPVKNITDPLEMLKEIEAYLTFRLLSDTPTVPADDMAAIKRDIAELLRANEIEVDFVPGKIDF